MTAKLDIGASVRRSEDIRFLQGKGRYIDDIMDAGLAHGVFLRSTEAHAKIKSVDTSEAEAHPGVLLVLTGKEWNEQGFGPIPNNSATKKNKDGSDYFVPPRHCLPLDRVRFAGEAVALVVAESFEQARDAAELIDIDYEELEAVTDLKRAAEDDAPRIWDDIPNNVSIDFELGDAGRTKELFDSADHVVTLDVKNNKVTSVPIEPRGAIASYDTDTDSYTLINASQNIHANRNIFAEKILNIEPDKLHHLAPDIGGGFGAKNSVYPEPAVLLHAAKKTERTIKWINDRGQSFLSDTHGRGQITHAELALDKEGKFLALRCTTIGDIGAYCGSVGPFTPAGGSARTQGGPYAFEAIHYQGRAIFTNTAPLDPYRGAGRPEATYLLERLIEYAARTLDFDRIELRRKNLMQPQDLPKKSPTGLDIDCGNFPEVFRRALDMTDREGFAARKAASENKGKRLGFALCPYLECTGGAAKEFASVTFESDGTARLSSGSHSTGMGHETSLPQVLAAKLSLPIDRIVFVQADTQATPLGGGHGGSRSLEMGGGAVSKLSDEILEKARALAAHLLETGEDDLTFTDGVFEAAGRRMSMTQVVTASFDAARLPDGMAPGSLNTETTFERNSISIPNGSHAAEAEVDPETGEVRITHYWAVDDFGNIINPMLADGQVMGGVVQGIGQALLEESVYDPDSGQLLSGSLMDYALPRADHIPPMDIAYYEDAPTKRNPLGVKGSGEAGCVGAPPVIVNAVLDALVDEGVLDLDMPLTPGKVWKAISEASKNLESQNPLTQPSPQGEGNDTEI